MTGDGDEEALGWATCGHCGTKNPPTKDECKDCNREI